MPRWSTRYCEKRFPLCGIMLYLDTPCSHAE
jgi:hypothetical protein